MFLFCFLCLKTMLLSAKVVRAAEMGELEALFYDVCCFCFIPGVCGVKHSCLCCDDFCASAHC